MRILLALLLAAAWLPAQQPPDPGAARTYLVKLSTPVSTAQSRQGDPIKAAIISPESLLNGYLEGVIESVSSGKLVLRFNRVQYKGKTTPIRTEVVGWVNSKGHKDVDDDEKPLKLQAGTFSGPGRFWLDEGSELRVRAEPAQ